jgi:gliding motility-associated-like protein
MKIWLENFLFSVGKPWRLLWFLILNAFTGFSQQTPVNIGFESGNFSGWSAFTGQCCPVNTPATGLDSSRHFITSGNGTDTLSQGLITLVAPGSSWSARLGNAENLAEGEALEYTFAVSSDSMILNIRFAVLLEDGLHPVSKQPRFNYMITTASGQPLPGCTEEEVLAGSPFPGKIKFGTLEILPWQTRSINLTGMIGQLVNLRFETGDCGPGGHFGYAYIDCDLTSSAINYSACNQDGSLSLQVSPGLNGQWFNGSTADSIHIQNPIQGSSYYYELNPGTGCPFSVYPNKIDSVLPSANFSYSQGCDNMISFHDLSVVQTGSDYNWDFGDSHSSNLTNPDHYFSVNGAFNSTLTLIQPNNCKSEITLPVTVLAPLNFQLIKPPAVCKGDFFTLEIDSGTQIASCEWQIGSDIYSGTPVTISTFTEGEIPVSVQITDHSGCEHSLYDAITITDCAPVNENAFVPSAFTPNGDGINDVFTPSIPMDATEIRLTVYNRFGQRVCIDTEWKGNFNGVPSPQGIYTYRLSFILNNKPHFQTGVLSLIR